MPIPTGTVQIKQGGFILATLPLDASGNFSGTLMAGTDLSIGVDQIFAVYSGDPNFQTSESPTVNETINPAPTPAPTTTTLTAAPNPATVGQNVTIQGSVTPS